MSEVIKAMVAVMADVGAVGKDQVNQQQKFNYRGIDDVYNALHLAMAKHGLVSLPEVLDKTQVDRASRSGGVLIYTSLRIRYHFYATDGSTVSCVVEGEGMDSGDKSSNKAMAVAHKYALLQAFCIPTAEVKDPDAESHQVASFSAAQHQAYMDALEAKDALGYLALLTGLDDQQKIDLFNSFPAGQKTANKQKAKELEAAGHDVVAEYVSMLIEAEGNKDDDAIRQAWDELATPEKRKLVWAALPAASHYGIKESLKSSETEKAA